MKLRLFFTLLLLSLGTAAFAQVGVAYHQSGLPFAEVHYEFGERVRPLFRPGVDSFFDNFPLELAITYDILDREDYEFYAGLGGRINGFEGAVIPIGLNVYPFDNKRFGFHIEVAPIIGDADILRGSWGMRYRFTR
ncbi:hypothetical protein AB9P05_13375 [Roseivirga sp. BDSF3-8]|uniref:hypothetical protein n=1 Tax=Roseivirga sp. BDSF3-8 TaxID=3241598 RepID=UPI003531D7D5